MASTVYRLTTVLPEKNPKGVSRLRCIFAQVVATTVKNFLLLQVGLCISLPTIIIPALRGIQNEHNRDEVISITSAQASWLGSIGYLVQPLGSLLSTLITDSLGRRRSMMLVNVPYFCGWFMLCQANTIDDVFIGFVMLGLAVGLMEAPVVTYLGEICEPSTRGVLLGYTLICTTFGMLTIYIMNAMMAWRTVTMWCTAVPVISVITIYFIPETPQWLLSKSRINEAERSLQWLRGWTTHHNVAQEFADLQRHSEQSKSCHTCTKLNAPCTHPLPTMREKFAELKRKRILKPLTIVLSLFFLVQFTGTYSMRPFMVQIFTAYDSPVAPDRAITIMSALDNLMCVLFMCVVRCTGKRRLYLTMLFGMFACALVTTVYGFLLLPSDYSSFDPTQYYSIDAQRKHLTYIPLISLLLWSFFSFAGTPWIYLSELFPFKSRGIASSLAAALNYVFGFITKKIYFSLETTLSLPGTALFYCLICGIGLIFMYNVLPETENRSLEEIELHFADNAKTLCDRNIRKKSDVFADNNDMLLQENEAKLAFLS